MNKQKISLALGIAMLPVAIMLLPLTIPAALAVRHFYRGRL